VPNLLTISVAHPWVTIAILVTIIAWASYDFFSGGRAAMPRVEAPRSGEEGGALRKLLALGAWERAWRGARLGLVFPGVFTILILVIYLFGGRHQLSRGIEADFLVLSIAYPLGAAIMGAVLALGAPFMRGYVRSALVGMAALAPFLIGIGLSMDDGLTHWSSSQTEITFALTIVYGGMIGYVVGRRQGRSAASVTT